MSFSQISRTRRPRPRSRQKRNERHPQRRALALNQIQFLDEIVNHLTANGVMDAARLYEAPYTYFHPLGVEGVFKGPEIDELLPGLEEVKSRAIA